MAIIGGIPHFQTYPHLKTFVLQESNIPIDLMPSHCAAPWENGAKALNHSLRCSCELAANCRIHRPDFSCRRLMGKNWETHTHTPSSWPSGNLVGQNWTFLIILASNIFWRQNIMGQSSTTGWFSIARAFSQRVIYSWTPMRSYEQAFRMFPSMDWLSWSKSQETMSFPIQIGSGPGVEMLYTSHFSIFFWDNIRWGSKKISTMGILLSTIGLCTRFQRGLVTFVRQRTRFHSDGEGKGSSCFIFIQFPGAVFTSKMLGKWWKRLEKSCSSCSSRIPNNPFLLILNVPQILKTGVHLQFQKKSDWPIWSLIDPL